MVASVVSAVISAVRSIGAAVTARLRRPPRALLLRVAALRDPAPRAVLRDPPRPAPLRVPREPPFRAPAVFRVRRAVLLLRAALRFRAALREPADLLDRRPPRDLSPASARSGVEVSSIPWLLVPRRLVPSFSSACDASLPAFLTPRRGIRLLPRASLAVRVRKANLLPASAIRSSRPRNFGGVTPNLAKSSQRVGAGQTSTCFRACARINSHRWRSNGVIMSRCVDD
jgi:hypothetical protein